MTRSRSTPARAGLALGAAALLLATATARWSCAAATARSTWS
ncbi:hypothetical protein ACWEVY_21370 [Streptomyces longwoodensis]